MSSNGRCFGAVIEVHCSLSLFPKGSNVKILRETIRIKGGGKLIFAPFFFPKEYCAGETKLEGYRLVLFQKKEAFDILEELLGEQKLRGVLGIFRRITFLLPYPTRVGKSGWSNFLKRLNRIFPIKNRVAV